MDPFRTIIVQIDSQAMVCPARALFSKCTEKVCHRINYFSFCNYAVFLFTALLYWELLARAQMPPLDQFVFICILSQLYPAISQIGLNIKLSSGKHTDMIQQIVLDVYLIVPWNPYLSNWIIFTIQKSQMRLGNLTPLRQQIILRLYLLKSFKFQNILWWKKYTNWIRRDKTIRKDKKKKKKKKKKKFVI